MRAKRVLPLISGATLLLALSPLAHAEDLLEPCRIKSPDTTNHMRVGWPVDKDSMKSIGKTNILVLVVDFSDAPKVDLNVSAVKQQMELSTIANYYSTVSNGLFEPAFTIFPNYLRMPESSAHYGKQLEVDEVVGGEWESHHMTHDAIDVASKSIKISGFDAAIVVISGGASLSGRVALATSQDEGLDTHESGEVHNTILVGQEAFQIEGIKPWRMLVHELNHLMGAADLYLYGTDGWWQGKGVGPFGLQAFVGSHSESDSLAWNRWMRGWIPESRILCATSDRDLLKAKMSPPGSKDKNYEMIIFKKSATEVFVVEALKTQGFEASTIEKSLLVYRVDSTIEAGKAPIKIIPRKTATTSAPLSPNLPDSERFREAPITTYQQVFFEDYLFRNVEFVNGATVFSFFVGSNAVTQSKVVPKTITCKKGKKVLKIKGYSPSCQK